VAQAGYFLFFGNTTSPVLLLMQTVPINEYPDGQTYRTALAARTGAALKGATMAISTLISPKVSFIVTPSGLRHQIARN
jgi:hypothetical protein